MRRENRNLGATSALLCALILFFGNHPCSAQRASFWNDPTFRKEFLGSYGFQAEIEPKMNDIERQQMEKLASVMGQDLPAAGRALAEVTTKESTALFDFTLGNIYLQTDRTDAALAAYKSAVAKFPSFRRAHRNLGMVLAQKEQHDEALQALARAIELGDNQGSTFGLLGFSYTAKGDLISAETAYRQAILLQGNVIDWKLGLARILLKQEKAAEAAAVFNELARQNPDRVEFWTGAAASYLALKQAIKAATTYEILSRMGKATGEMMTTAGDIYVNENLFNLAASAYTRSLELDANNGLAKSLRAAEILASRGGVDQAKGLTDRIERTFENMDAESRKSFLKVQARIALASEADDQSAELLKEVITLDPMDGDALILLGQYYTRKGDPGTAIFHYERAGNIEKFEADAKIRHAQLLVGQSKYADAIPLLKRAQELKPRESVARYLEQVERFAKSRT